MGVLDRFRSNARPAQPQKFDAAATLAERQAMALVDLGNACEDQGAFDQALAHYTDAIHLAPDSPRARLNLGNVLIKKGDLRGALMNYQLVLAGNPSHVGARFNSGNALRRLGEFEAARQAYCTVLQLQPDFVDAHVALGCTLEDMGFFQKAVASFERALELRPQYPQVERNVAGLLHRLGSIDGARERYRRALAIDENYLEAHNDLLFIHQFDAALDHAQAFADALAFGRVVEALATPYSSWHGSLDRARPLRIGLVSGDLRSHPVGYFIESVLRALRHQARDRPEVYAYLTEPCNDVVSERIAALCDGWVAVERLSDQELAARIHTDAIDILIDLAGHTGRNRLAVFAWRPSGVQVSWLGYFATTGLDAIDVLIADASLPVEQEQYFTERVVRMPHTRLCFTPPDEAVAVNPLPALHTTGITFGCFNNLLKIGDQVVSAWCRVLHALPASRLILKSDQFSFADVGVRLHARFAAHGIDVTRVLLEREASRREYLEAYHRIDIALDPFPYGGGTTTVEALWMGVPVLTLAGQTMLAQQGNGLVSSAGLGDWVASDLDGYVALAMLHARDLKS